MVHTRQRSVLKVAGAAADRLIFLSPRLPSSGPAVDKFRESYRKKYSAEPGILAANAYDATTITVQALRQCKLDTTCAKDRIYQIKDFPGVSGVFSITAEGGTIKDFVRKSVKNGTFVQIANVDAR